MMATYSNAEIDRLAAFFTRMKKASSGDFKKKLTIFLDGIGNEFLVIVVKEIKRRKVMDTRYLYTSFHKGEVENVWELNEGNLTLEVGTNVEYAKWVNDGHSTCKKGETSRFVPGRWDGNRFIYQEGAKTGMMLKQKWIDGNPYFDSAEKLLEKLFPNLLERMLQQWLDQYFKDFI